MNVALLLLTLLPLVLSVHLPVSKSPQSMLPERQVSFPPPGSKTPAPLPCVPGSVSVSFKNKSSRGCKGTRKGRLLTVKIDDGCVFQTFEVRFCRRSKLNKLVRGAKKCIGKKALLCESRKRFLDCGLRVVKVCSKGKIVSAGAVA